MGLASSGVEVSIYRIVPHYQACEYTHGHGGDLILADEPTLLAPFLFRAAQ